MDDKKIVNSDPRTRVPGNNGGVLVHGSLPGRPGYDPPTMNLREKWRQLGDKLIDDLTNAAIDGRLTMAQMAYLADVASKYALPQKVHVHVSESKIMDLLPAALSDALADLDDSTAMRVVERFLFNLQESLGQDKRSE